MQGFDAYILSKQRTFFDLTPNFGGGHSVVAQTDACTTEHMLIVALLQNLGQAGPKHHQDTTLPMLFVNTRAPKLD